MPHRRHGAPRGVLAAAVDAIAQAGLTVEAASPVIASAALGPSRRQYANAAAVVSGAFAPDDALAVLQGIEHDFGRRRRGARWRARVLDLDIILWGGGAWSSDRLTIPHPRFRERRFVLAPAAAIAPGWRDPITGLTVRQLQARLTRANPVS